MLKKLVIVGLFSMASMYAAGPVSNEDIVFRVYNGSGADYHFDLKRFKTNSNREAGEQLGSWIKPGSTKEFTIENPLKYHRINIDTTRIEITPKRLEALKQLDGKYFDINEEKQIPDLEKILGGVSKS